MVVTTPWHDWPTNFSGTMINSTGTYIQSADQVTGCFLSAGFLLIIWIMVFFAGVVLGVKRSLSAACFITFVFSVYFWRLDMMHPAIVISLLVFAIVFAIGSKFEGGAY